MSRDSTTSPVATPPSVASLAATSSALVGYNLALNLVPLPDPLYVPANLGLTAAVLYGLGRSWGVEPADAGLVRRNSGRQLVVGGAVVGVVAVGLLGALGLPAAQPLLADERAAGLTGAGLLYAAFVRIPLGTAVPEEVIFRGVLLEGFARRLGRGRGVLAASAVFGLWHIGPTLRLIDENALDLHPLATAAVVGGAVVATTAAGVGFWLLRRWGGGLLAPILAHAGINASSLLAAAASQRGL